MPGAIGSQVNFLTDSTAGSATFFAEGGQAEDALDGVILFSGTSLDSAENANFTINGSTPGSAFGGDLLFDQESDVGNAICVINGGTDGGPGGVLELTSSCTGGTARIELFGNGTLEMGSHDAPGVSVGSIEGDGLVFLGANNLTTGTNGLSTTFSGVIQDAGFSVGTGGSLTKVGTGSLTLSGANTHTGGTILNAGTLVVANQSGSGTGTLALSGPNAYTGGTTIEEGTFLVQTKNASATGTGPVELNAGTVGGRGKMSGAVTIGSGTGTGHSWLRE